MITINSYSGQWQSALRPAPPRVCSCVRVHDNPDAREIDDFQRCLRSHGLHIDLGDSVKRLPRLKMDVYTVKKGAAQ